MKLIKLISFCVVALAVLALCFKLQLQRQEQWRLKQILPMIQMRADFYNLDRALVQALIWKESRYDSNAVGKKGEIGLMQLMDGAVSDWARENKQPKPDKSQLFNPEINIAIGCWYLAKSTRRWDGYASQVVLGLAEYNAGHRNADAWKPADKNTKVQPQDITFPSTRDYIKQILRKRKEIIANQTE